MDFEPSKDITIYDIARELNISAATVSRSLADHSGTSKVTKGKVLAKARQMCYSYNNYASNLRRKQSKVIGVIVPRLNSHFIGEAIAGIEMEVSKAGYTLMVFQSLEKMENEINHSLVLANYRVAGVLVSLAENTTEFDHFLQVAQRNIPVIFFDRIIEQPFLPCIAIDNYLAGYELTMHLVSKGHSRIMHVTADLTCNVYAERYKGYLRALHDSRLRFDKALLIVNHLSDADAINVAKQIKEMQRRPHAVFFANDNCAAHSMIELQRLGLSIPGDIAIAGFNNDPIAQMIKPNITTVHYSGFEIGTQAALMLINGLLSITDGKKKGKVMCPFFLVERESTGPEN